VVLSLSGISVTVAMLATGPGLAKSADVLPSTARVVNEVSAGPARSFRVRTESGSIRVLQPSLTFDGVAGFRPVVEGRHMIRVSTEPVLVKWESIERVEEPSSGVGRGFIVGMATGALAFTGLWLVFDEPDERPTPDTLMIGPPYAVRGYLSFLSGALFGAVTGMLVGTLTPRWDTVALGPLASPEHRSGSRHNPSE